jgi:hypothetical protein
MSASEKISSSTDHHDHVQSKSNVEAVTRRHSMMHKRWQLSEKKLEDIKETLPRLYSSIQQTPWKLVHYWDDGLAISRSAFLGIQRNGPEYIDTWIRENKVEVSDDAFAIISMMKFYHTFVTYDRAYLYLRKHAPELLSNKAVKDLDQVDHYSSDEEEKIKIERADLEQRKKAEAEHLEQYESLKKEEERLEFAIEKLKATVVNYNEKKKFAEAFHYQKEIDGFEERLAHVKDKIQEWHKS